MYRSIVSGAAPALMVAIPLLVSSASAQPQIPRPESQPAPQSAPAQGPTYEFLAPGHTKSHRLYRVHRTNGEVVGCWYEGNQGVGNTKCFPSGEGAGAQTPGDYGLTASHREDEGSVFRVNRQSGEVSICYVSNEKTVCTPPAR